MKRVRCPKCDHYIVFDETQYTDGQSLVFVCQHCKKEFGIRIGKSKLANRHEEKTLDEGTILIRKGDRFTPEKRAMIDAAFKAVPKAGFREVSCSMKGAAGVHDLYFVFTSGGFRWDWWKMAR